MIGKMMRFLFLIVFLSSPALAGDYSKHVDKQYGVLRDLLIFDQWQPKELTPVSDCYNNKSAKCLGYPEIQHCAGTGQAPCKMAWTRNGHTLIVFTKGEVTPFVTQID